MVQIRYAAFYVLFHGTCKKITCVRPPVLFFNCMCCCQDKTITDQSKKTREVGQRQCCGSRMFIPYPGSKFFPSRIPDPPSKNLSILTQKIDSKKKKALGNIIRVVHPGSGSGFFYPTRIQGSKKHRIPELDPQH
jgi:hypothetical protein